MTPLPGLDGDKLLAWRLDNRMHAAIWDSGEGAYRAGGRWNSPGVRAVYCSADPATATLEVAVHKGFTTLDRVPHVLTAATIIHPKATLHILDPTAIPNPDWLRPGIPSAEQQEFGDRLLSQHKVIALPSTVSSHSWSLIFIAATAGEVYKLASQEAFVLDPRIHG